MLVYSYFIIIYVDKSLNIYVEGQKWWESVQLLFMQYTMKQGCQMCIIKFSTIINTSTVNDKDTTTSFKHLKWPVLYCTPVEKITQINAFY